MPVGDSYVTSGAVKMSEAESREHEATMFAKRVMEVPHNLQLRQAISRSDGQPDYIGYGARGLAADVTGWLLYKFTYDSNGFVTVRQSAYNTWDNRASATYA